jgi:drug/metabolite transporter (DMT)-like permease
VIFMAVSWKGHILALITVLIWGMTFISSKVLVGLLDSYWLIVVRFVLAWAALFLLSPKPLRLLSLREEGKMILCGILGVTAYYAFQNVALIYSTASNTGVISALAPLFTALILWLFGRRVKLRPIFFLGFVLCFGGVAAISLGGENGGVHLLGDSFALLSALSWGLYCVVVAFTEGSDLTDIQVTRKIFFWGLLLSIPLALILGEPFDPTPFLQDGLHLWGNLLFVSLASSALCYLFWGKATALLGAVTTSVYMYLIPVVSVIGSALILRESVSLVTVVAIAVILVGLVFSQRGNSVRP